MKLLLAIFALCLSASLAAAQLATLGAGPMSLGFGPFTPSSITPQVSAYFTPDNAQHSGLVNNALKLNGGTAGAFYVPSTTTKSWFVYVEGVTQDTPIYKQASQLEYLLTSCTSALCTGGNLRVLGVEDPGYAAPMSFFLNVQRSSNLFWLSEGVASVATTNGTGTTSNAGLYSWTGTGGTVGREPSGFVFISSTCAFSTPTVVDPGFLITVAPTLGITSYPSGCSGGTVTPTLGYSTGIQTKPGQHWCGVIGQYGSDAVNATNGYQFAAFVDSSGNALTGSPAVATTANNTASGSNFYYNSGTLQSQASIGDIFNLVGSAYTTAGSNQNGWGGQIGPVGMIWGEFPNTASVPTAATLSNLCTKTVDPLSYFNSTFTTANVRSFYKLNTSGFVDSSVGNGGSAWSAMGVVGSVGLGNPTAAGPALAITDNGPYTTWPVTNYSAGTGTIAVSGTYNVAALGGTPSAIQAQISTTPGGSALSGFSWANLSSATLGGGAWSGSISGVPAGGPYYVSVRAANGQAYVYTGNATQVGLLIGWGGQSQQTDMWANGSPAGTGSTLEMQAPTAGGYAAAVGPLDLTNVTTYGYLQSVSIDGYFPGHTGLRPFTPSSTANFGSYSVVGDGITALVNTLETLSGWPVELVYLAHPGFASDAWVNGYVTQGPTTTSGSGAGPYAATLSFAESSLPTSPTPGVTNVTASVLAGTAKFYVGSTLAATDQQAVSLGISTSTTCAGQNGYTVSACSINYLTGAASITFSATPASAPTVKWTNIVDIASGASAANLQTTQYDGFDWFGNGAASSGFISNVMSREPAPFSLFVEEQCSANSGELNNAYSSFSSPNGPYSLTIKMSYLYGAKYPAAFPQVSTTPPILFLGYPRDYELMSGSEWNEINNCAQWTHDIGTSGAGAHYTGAGAYAYGGTYLDNAVQQSATYGTISPHQTSGPFGGARVGRRAGANIWAFLNGSTLAQQPALSTTVPGVCDAAATASPCFDVSSSGCSGTSGVSSNCIDVNFSLNPVATSLATCGTGLANATHPPSGTCATTTTGANVEGFRIGPSTSALYFDDGLDPYNVNFNNSAASHNEFTCSILSATVVQCKKATGSWTSGSTYLMYGDMWYASRSGTLVGTKSGTGYTISAAGTCTGSGSGHVAMTGGTGTAPQIQFTYTSASGITAATPYTPGALSGGTPVVALPSGCSGATLSTTLGTGAYVNTGVDDDNLLGQYLYDNSGSINTTTIYGILHGSGSAQAPCNQTGQCEPGLPATPFGVTAPVAVSG